MRIHITGSERVYSMLDIGIFRTIWIFPRWRFCVAALKHPYLFFMIRLRWRPHPRTRSRLHQMSTRPPPHTFRPTALPLITSCHSGQPYPEAVRQHRKQIHHSLQCIQVPSGTCMMAVFQSRLMAVFQSRLMVVFQSCLMAVFQSCLMAVFQSCPDGRVPIMPDGRVSMQAPSNKSFVETAPKNVEVFHEDDDDFDDFQTAQGIKIVLI